MKPIRLSNHAAVRALQRGASLQEIVSCIRGEEWLHLSSCKYSARKTFSFHSLSPLNGKRYNFKAVETIFADEKVEIVVVTVKVYYFDEKN